MDSRRDAGKVTSKESDTRRVRSLRRRRSDPSLTINEDDAQEPEAKIERIRRPSSATSDSDTSLSSTCARIDARVGLP